MTKVLVVDDTPDMVWLMKKIVEAQGHDVLVANDGPAALAIAAAERPDAVLLDVMMPGMSGIEVLRQLKANHELRSIPVILVTAMGDDQDVIAGLDSGAHDYVTKPFKKQILAARVRSAIRGKRNHDRLIEANQQIKSEIAERQRMQLELARAQKLESIGHLAAGIAHEINTPAQYLGDNTRFLQEMFGDVDRLLEVFDRMLQAAKQGKLTDELIAEVESAVQDADVDYLTEEVPKAIEQSLEGIEHMANIVRAMKDFSHPGSGHKQAIDLNRAIRSTLTVSRGEWKYVADLVTDFDAGLPLVECMPGDFNQVILNLVVNAAQAIGESLDEGSTEKGTLSVRTRQDADWVEIRIEDTGTGIPDDIRDSVFDHFFTTKEVGKGTGQGLAIAHSIVVEKHGGTIDFESEVGKGTTFIVRLPVVDPTRQAETATPQGELEPQTV